jgi:hypothetical protein
MKIAAGARPRMSLSQRESAMGRQRMVARGPQKPIGTTLDRTSRGKQRDAVQGNADGRRNHDRLGRRHRLGAAGGGRSHPVRSRIRPDHRGAGRARTDRSSADTDRAPGDSATDGVSRRDRGHDDPIGARRIPGSPNVRIVVADARSDPAARPARVRRSTVADHPAHTIAFAGCHADAKSHPDAHAHADCHPHLTADARSYACDDARSYACDDARSYACDDARSYACDDARSYSGPDSCAHT